MKTLKSTFIICTVLLLAVLTLLSSCDKADEFTIENKQVTGTINYTTTSFVPTSFDSTGTIPLSAHITMIGQGTISDLGDITMDAAFDFNFVTGMGTNFVTTYTGINVSDTFLVNGTSQAQPDGSFHANENIISGTGKFSKISGGGLTIVNLDAQQSAGTGEFEWVVTY